MSELDLGYRVYFRDWGRKANTLFVTEPLGTPNLCRALSASPVSYREALIAACKQTHPEIVQLLMEGGALSSNGEFMSLDLASLIRRWPVDSIDYQIGKVGLLGENGFLRVNSVRMKDLSGDMSYRHRSTYLIHPSLKTHLAPEVSHNHISGYHQVRVIHEPLLREGWSGKRADTFIPGSFEPSFMNAFFGLADLHLCAEGVAESPLSPKDIARQAVIDVIEAQRTIPAPQIPSHLASLMSRV